MPHPACNCRPYHRLDCPAHGEDNRPVYCDSCHTDTMDERRDLDDARTACRSCGVGGYGRRWSHR
jgi:formylmethanofuran dehydrogenase subunit E